MGGKRDVWENGVHCVVSIYRMYILYRGHNIIRISTCNKDKNYYCTVRFLRRNLVWHFLREARTIIYKIT